MTNAKKLAAKKLALNKESLRRLDDLQLVNVAAGMRPFTAATCTEWGCNSGNCW